MSKLELKTVGDTQVVITRQFAAAPEAVYRAHIEPELLQQWCLGPDGWTMPVCIVEPRPGGRMRYEWADAYGHGFYLTGEFVELTPYSKLHHIERWHLPDPTPDNNVVTTFEPFEGGTRITMTMNLPSKEVRDSLAASGMAGGLEDSYARLEEIQRGVVETGG